MHACSLRARWWCLPRRPAGAQYWHNRETNASRWNVPPSCAWQRAEINGQPHKYINYVTSQTVHKVPVVSHFRFAVPRAACSLGFDAAQQRPGAQGGTGHQLCASRVRGRKNRLRRRWRGAWCASKRKTFGTTTGPTSRRQERIVRRLSRRRSTTRGAVTHVLPRRSAAVLRSWSAPTRSLTTWPRSCRRTRTSGACAWWDRPRARPPPRHALLQGPRPRVTVHAAPPSRARAHRWFNPKTGEFMWEDPKFQTPWREIRAEGKGERRAVVVVGGARAGPHHP